MGDFLLHRKKDENSNLKVYHTNKKTGMQSINANQNDTQLITTNIKNSNYALYVLPKKFYYCFEASLYISFPIIKHPKHL